MNGCHTQISKSDTIKSQRGASLVEYCMLMALIAVISVGAVKGIGYSIGNLDHGVLYKAGNGISAASGITQTNDTCKIDAC